MDVKNSTFGNKKINVKFILENKRGRYHFGLTKLAVGKQGNQTVIVIS